MNTIEELEKQIKVIKEKKLQTEWESYLNKLEGFLESIKNKCILQWTMNGQFFVFKVTDVKKQYHIGSRNGGFGDWHPSRYFEINSKGYFSCSVANDMGKYFRPGVDSNFNWFRFEKHSKTFDISKFNYCEKSVEFKLGYEEYEKNLTVNESLAADVWSRFYRFTVVIPEEIYTEIKKIHDNHAKATIDFWEKYKDTINSCPKIQPI